MDTFTRICKKCLLREMSYSYTYKTLFEYIANLNPDYKLSFLVYCHSPPP